MLHRLLCGDIKLENYKGKWLVFFSHPGDFNPVCTTEIIAFAKANMYFEQTNCSLLGLSVDSNPSHLAWEYDILQKTGVSIPFPIIADRNGEIARKYGMISSSVSSTETVRSVYIIDDKQIIRAILTYPITIGRNISEILRIVRALQAVDSNNLMAPANWVPGEQMIEKLPKTFKELERRNEEIASGKNGISWYLTFEEPKRLENRENKDKNIISNKNIEERREQNQELLKNKQPRTLQWKNFR